MKPSGMKIKRFCPVGLLFVGSLLLFMLVMPGNHSEAEDAFEYSRLIEEGQGARQFHPHHLLFIPVEKAVFHTVQALGYGGRSYYVARAVSMVSGSLALCFFYLIACRLQLLAGMTPGGWVPWSTTLGLLFSYGFLRYACEVEIYVPASALMLVGIYCSLRENQHCGMAVLAILFSAFAVLLHVINAAAAFVVVPLIYVLTNRHWKRAWVHVVSTLVVVGAVYWFVQSTWGTFKPATDMASEGGFRPGSLLKAGIGFGQSLLSANFLFAYDTIYQKLQAIFPYRMFAEEVFAGSCIPSWLRMIAPITFVSALVGLGVLVVQVFRSVARCRWCSGTLTWILVWLGGAILPTLMLEPSNPELWVMALIPLWLMAAWLLMSLPSSSLTKPVSIVAIALLGLHNLIAGMGIMKSKNGDYLFKKAEWVIQVAGKNDVINTADSFVFTFYLDYWGKAEVRNINTQEWKMGETTYVLGDVFNPPKSIGVRYPNEAAQVAKTAAELSPLCTKVHDDIFGGVWILVDHTVK